jgi:hypothetical protein
MEENQVAVVNDERSVTEVRAQVNKIQELMSSVMNEGVHFGVVPGCGEKPSLLKPGAEKLCFVFKVAPEFEVHRDDLPGGHREYQITCRLKSMTTGAIIGEGVGSCSTMESKYRWRNAAKKCPSCGKETIIKGKEEYGGGWVCLAKRGGCGAKYDDKAPEIINQPVGKVENTDIADTYNTVLKMAKKRAHVDATITAFAASDIFTQDIEDMGEMRQVSPDSEPEHFVKTAEKSKFDWKAKAAASVIQLSPDDKKRLWMEAKQDENEYWRLVCAEQDKIAAAAPTHQEPEAEGDDFQLTGEPTKTADEMIILLMEYAAADETPSAAKKDIEAALNRNEKDPKVLAALIEKVKSAVNG